jgi:prepilin-type N-terminal cleavage/methylation domain-containing protein
MSEKKFKNNEGGLVGLGGQQKGFTLIELLVVIAIIGLLASLSLVALNSAREKARNSRRMTDIKQIQTALELRYNEEKNYPTSLDFGGSGQIANSDSSTVYMDQVPSNPEPRDDGDCADANYTYSTANANTTYEIQYCISEPTGGIAEGTHTATPAGLATD